MDGQMNGMGCLGFWSLFLAFPFLSFPFLMYPTNETTRVPWYMRVSNSTATLEPVTASYRHVASTSIEPLRMLLHRTTPSS